MTKMTKEETDYSRGHIDSHCGKVFPDDKGHCKHYHAIDGESGSCDIVEGKIKAVYWCDQWERAKE